jgi:hypothetical protein
MGNRSRPQRAALVLGAAAGVALGVYGTYAGVTWLRYGHPPRPARDDTDPLLDRFMPTYDVCDRHRTRVRAPAATTFAAACELDLLQQPVVRAIVRAREMLLGAEPDARVRPRGLLAETRALGWGTLAERPQREIVMGAVTKPWEAEVTFRAVPPDDFAAFAEPGYVKIAWTLRADPIGPDTSMFRTETRAVATDAVARARFRRYWAFLSPGIVLIRLVSLAPVRARAERRHSAAR